MKEYIIINIRHKTFTLDDKELIRLASTRARNFNYRFIPVVVYNKKKLVEETISVPVLKSLREPFGLYELGTSIAILKNYMGSKITKEDLISAKKAFRSLKGFASQCYERIIADLCCQVIIDELRGLKDGQHLVFFIEKSASDKMLGRLASLYLNLEKATICFLSYGPADLMTTVMGHQTGKLSFDIHRLMDSGIADFIGPYPGDFEDSLTQTYFHKPAPSSEWGIYRPFRIDIFAQGLLIDRVEEKKELIKQIFEDSKNREFDDKDEEFANLVPRGFVELGEYLKGTLEKEIRQKMIINEGNA